jgi:tRNA(adenine34) deaminase
LKTRPTFDRIYLYAVGEEWVDKDEYYMRQALREAAQAQRRGEVPVGAVLVKDGQIIAAAGNCRENRQDATAHAEMVVIQQACAHLRAWRLTGSTIYVTLEPCPMCAGALIMARVDRLVYGCSDSRAGAVESLFNLTGHPALNHQLTTRAGVCEEECRALLREFFQNKR